MEVELGRKNKKIPGRERPASRGFHYYMGKLKKTYYIFTILRLTPITPSNPVPKRIKVTGSGT